MSGKGLGLKVQRGARKGRESLWRTDQCVGTYICEAFDANRLEVQWNLVLTNEECKAEIWELKAWEVNDEVILEEFLIQFIPVRIKPLTDRAIWVYKEFERVVREAKSESLEKQFELMPVYFVLSKWKRIRLVLEFLRVSGNRMFECWSVWSELFLKRKSKVRCRGVTVYEKLGNFYAIMYSNAWGYYKDSVFLAGNQELGELQSILLADLGLFYNNVPEDTQNIKILTENLENKYKKLAFCKLLYHYFNNNLLTAAQMLCVYIKNKYEGDLKNLAEGVLMKINGKLKIVQDVTNPHNLLENYHFIRSCVKYNLNVPVNKLTRSCFILSTTLSAYKFTTNMFDVKVTNR